MVNIVNAQQPPSRYRLHGFAHQHTVHDNICTYLEICGCKFVFGRNVGRQCITAPGKVDRIAFRQVSQGDQDVVSRIEL